VESVWHEFLRVRLKRHIGPNSGVNEFFGASSLFTTQGVENNARGSACDSGVIDTDRVVMGRQAAPRRLVGSLSRPAAKLALRNGLQRGIKARPPTRATRPRQHRNAVSVGVNNALIDQRAAPATKYRTEKKTIARSRIVSDRAAFSKREGQVCFSRRIEDRSPSLTFFLASLQSMGVEERNVLLCRNKLATQAFTCAARSSFF
jgi:hypothetical protein